MAIPKMKKPKVPKAPKPKWEKAPKNVLGGKVRKPKGFF
jgi:hypothetical protein